MSMEWLKAAPRLRRTHFYWPHAFTWKNLCPNLEALADVLGSVCFQVSLDVDEDELFLLFKKCAERDWTVGLFWSPLYDRPWHEPNKEKPPILPDPRINFGDAEARKYLDARLPSLAVVDGAIRLSGVKFRWFFDCERFCDRSVAKSLGMTPAEYTTATVALFDELEAELVNVIPPGTIDWYGMGWRQWSGGVPGVDHTSIPQNVQDEYVPSAASARDRGQVVIDRPMYPEGWLTSYCASMVGKRRCTAWPWLWMAKLWHQFSAASGAKPPTWAQSDVAGDYGMIWARDMGRRLAELPRVDRICLYPNPTEWGNGTHLLNYIIGYSGLPITPPARLPPAETIGHPAIPVAAVRAAERIKPKGST